MTAGQFGVEYKEGWCGCNSYPSLAQAGTFPVDAGETDTQIMNGRPIVS